jgi:hypothetical protein
MQTHSNHADLQAQRKNGNKPSPVCIRNQSDQVSNEIFWIGLIWYSQNLKLPSSVKLIVKVGHKIL